MSLGHINSSVNWQILFSFFNTICFACLAGWEPPKQDTHIKELLVDDPV
jgi:hypothetical protein